MPWIGHAAVVAIVVTLVLKPLAASALAARRRARRARAALGEPVSPQGRSGTDATLAGRLALSAEPCEAFDGRPAAATSVFRRRCRRGRAGADASRRAESIALVTDEGEHIELDGPIEVRVGSNERAPRWRFSRLPPAMRTGIRSAANLYGRDFERSRMSIRSVRDGDRVLVRGRLERDPAGASSGHYRSEAGDWKLVAAEGEDGETEPIAVVHAGTPRVRPVPRELVLRTIVLGGLLLGALPWGLLETGEKLSRGVNDQLRDCDPAAFAKARTVDRLHVVQRLFPGWAATATDARASLIGSVINGVQVCAIGTPPPRPLVDGAADFAAERLPAVVNSERFELNRKEVEGLLHERARDRRLIDLANTLPEGGDVAARVRAHLYLGDLDAAAEVWREPGAAARYPFGVVVTKANVLCMAGDYDTALEAFAAQRKALEAEGARQVRLRPVLVHYAECLRRAGELERAAEVADEVSLLAYGVPDAAYLKALIEEDRGDLQAALEIARPHASDREPHHLLELSLLARTRDHETLLQRASQRALRHRLLVHRLDAGVYNKIFQPMLDEKRLRTVAQALEQLPDVGEAPEGESARELAGAFYLALAVRQARRWDPRAEGNFDRAEALRPDDGHVRRVRRVMAFFHGEWDALQDGDDSFPGQKVPWSALGEAYRGARVLEVPEDPFAASYQDTEVRMLNPSDLTVETGLARAYADDELSNGQRLELLRSQKQQTTWPAIFYRLTNLVVHGRHMGFDMREREAQLQALRAMFEDQPNHLLLAGIEGRESL